MFEKNSVKEVAELAIDKSSDIFHTIKEKAGRIGEWVCDNPQAAASMVASAAVAIRAGQSLVVSSRVRREQNRIDRTYYDRSSGHHWQLRRKLTNTDRAVIDRRKKRGDDMFDILSDLGAI